MALNANEAALIGDLDDSELDDDHQILVREPGINDKIGKWTIVGLVLNRTIGSGIFLTPHRVLAGAGCVGGALLLWIFGGLISMCALYVWLECGLSMPQRQLRGETKPRGVPRSGGDKNYLEFMFPYGNERLPHIKTTCSFAIMFILMYNLSGNALSFGLQVLTACGYHNHASTEAPPRGPVIGIAISVLTLVVMLHSISRKFGIYINNAFAIVKVGLLLTILCLGIAKAAGAMGGSGSVAKDNFTRGVWQTERSDVASWSTSLQLCLYAFSGYEQPFYVLAETKSPRKNFPKYTVLAMIFAIVLFLLVNISYLLVVDKSLVLPRDTQSNPHNQDLATLFFDALFKDDQEQAARAMAAVIAISIFGNLWVMTFTAARVKQEIAKEGILPWSLIIATPYRTPYALLKQWFSRRQIPNEQVEQAPTAAFGLHWLTSIFLLVVTSPIRDPRTSYAFLVSLYAYTIITLLGFFVSTGLIKIKLRKVKWDWQGRRRYKPWLSPAHAIIYATATAFMLVAAFIPPSKGSPYYESVTGLPWYLVPTIGITAPFWGMLWYAGLRLRERAIGRELTVVREPYWEPDPDCPKGEEYIQHTERVRHTWPIKLRAHPTHAAEGVDGSVMEMSRRSEASEQPSSHEEIQNRRWVG